MDVPLQSVPDFNQLVIVKTATIEIAANATAGVAITTTIPHNLGYIPITLAYVDVAIGATQGTVWSALPTATAGSLQSPVNFGFNNWIFSYADETNFYIVFISGITGNWGTYNYKYYLLQQKTK